MNRMVTKGYRKGVYERVTKGTRAGNLGAATCAGCPEGVLSLGAGVILRPSLF